MVGICDTPDELFHRIATALKASASRVRCDYVGLNHLGWVRHVYLDGKDVTAALLEDDDALDQLYPGGLFDKSPMTSRALIKLARAGGYPCFVADLREGRGIAVPFFGRPASSNPFPALIARVAEIPLYAAAVVRTKGAHFVMRVEPVEVPRGGDRDADVLATTAALQARFEQFIRDTPEQWMWAHRRWD